MKKTITISLLIIFTMLFITGNAVSQNMIPKDTTAILLMQAKKYQLGINTDVNLEKAYKIYYFLAKKGSAVAMNELGKMYRDGEGVKRNYLSAIKLFKTASELKNNDATCNLALIYQKGLGVNQNYKKALELYKKASDNGSANGNYGAGYLIYKGYGTTQDYNLAVSYFNKGADKKNSGCEYMLACYYLTGHDNKGDAEKGEKYLDLAMKHGHKWIEDFPEKGVTDSLIRISKKDKEFWKDVKMKRISNSKEDINNTASDLTLSGVWSGTRYIYDWSGSKIERQFPIRLQIECSNNLMELKWFENDSLITTYSAENLGNMWKPLKEKQFDINAMTRWFLFRSKFDVRIQNNKQVLYADLQTYNMDNRERLQPSVAVLEKEKNIFTPNPITIISVYPNPVDKEVNVSFYLNTAQKVSIDVYNKMGIKMFSTSQKWFDKGYNTENFSVNIPRDNYTVYLRGENSVCSQNIIKK